MKRLLEFLEEPQGGLSSCRLTLMLWTLGVLTCWVVVSIQKQALQPLDESVTTLTGILISGKVVQRFAERAPSPSIQQIPNPAEPQGLPKIPAKNAQ